MSKCWKAVVMCFSTLAVFFLQNLSSISQVLLSFIFQHVLMFKSPIGDTTDSDKLKNFKNGTIREKNQTNWDRKATYPWIGDPKCQHFVIKVCCNYVFLFIFVSLFDDK
jgi:hypothetical protein